MMKMIENQEGNTIVVINSIEYSEISSTKHVIKVNGDVFYSFDNKKDATMTYNTIITMLNNDYTVIQSKKVLY